MEEKVIKYFDDVLDLQVLQSPTLLSKTNNLVYEVVCSTNVKYIFKVVLDRDIDVAFLKKCNSFLHQKILTQKIIHIDRTRKHFDHSILIAEFIKGYDVAYVIENNLMDSVREKKLAEFLYDIFEATLSLELPKNGYGIYKLNHSLHPTFENYFYYFINRYVNRILNSSNNSSKWRKVYEILLQFYLKNIKERNSEFGVVSLDTNLKNIIFLEENDNLLLLNLPVLAYTDVFSGIGEICSQIKGSKTHQLFLELLKRKKPESSNYYFLILFYETLSFIGKLAFYCQEGEDRLNSVVSWGYKIPLAEQVFENINILEKANLIAKD